MKRSEEKRSEEKRRKKEDQRRSKKIKEDQRRESQKKEDPHVRKDRNAKHGVFPMSGAQWLKSRLAKAAGAEPCGQRRDEQLHALHNIILITLHSATLQYTPLQ